jgi:hypothetical protein
MPLARLITADPPRSFRDRGSRLALSYSGSGRRRYGRELAA